MVHNKPHSLVVVFGLWNVSDRVAFCNENIAHGLLYLHVLTVNPYPPEKYENIRQCPSAGTTPTKLGKFRIFSNTTFKTAEIGDPGGIKFHSMACLRIKTRHDHCGDTFDIAGARIYSTLLKHKTPL